MTANTFIAKYFKIRKNGFFSWYSDDGTNQQVLNQEVSSPLKGLCCLAAQENRTINSPTTRPPESTSVKTLVQGEV